MVPKSGAIYGRKAPALHIARFEIYSRREGSLFSGFGLSSNPSLSEDLSPSRVASSHLAPVPGYSALVARDALYSSASALCLIGITFNHESGLIYTLL